jgi:hypothetical protein
MSKGEIEVIDQRGTASVDPATGLPAGRRRRPARPGRPSDRHIPRRARAGPGLTVADPGRMDHTGSPRADRTTGRIGGRWHRGSLK